MILGLGLFFIGMLGLFIHRSLLRVGISAFFAFMGLSLVFLAAPSINATGGVASEIQASGQTLSLLTFFMGAMVAGIFIALAIRLFTLSGKEDSGELESLRH